MMRQALLALAILAASASPLAPVSPCFAQSGNPLIERGVTEYEDVRFEEALQTFSAALVRSGNTSADLVTIYRYLALTYLALGRQEEATGAYRSLLGLSPDFQPGSDVSPRFRDFFAGVRTAWEADGRPGLPAPAPVSIGHRSPPQADRGNEVELEATLDDPDRRVATLVLAYRQGTNAVFTRVDCSRGADGATFTATIPGSAVSPPLVEYYFEAIDGSGLPITSRGDVAAPLRIAVPAPGGDIASEPLFWVGIGGGVVVVAGAIILGVVLGSQGQAEGTLVFTIGD